MRIFLTITLFLLSLSGFTQALTSCFFADTSGLGGAAGYSMCKRGCAPLKIKINDSCSNVYTNPSNPKPLYYWGDGKLPFDSDTHTYFRPGIYNIKQVITAKSTTDSSTKYNYIEVLPNDPPAFNVFICINKVVTVKITDTNYDTFTIDFGDSFTTTASQGSTVSHPYTDTLSKTITVTGKYNLSNSCQCQASASETINPLNHLPVPDIGTLTENTQSSNGQIQLGFTPLTYVPYIVQWKTGMTGTYTTTNTIPTGATGPFNFTNTGNTQSNQYCSRVITFDECGDTVVSPDLCTTILTATAQNNQNVVTWQKFATGTFKDYTIIRNGVVDTVIKNSGTTSYIDKNIHCGVNYCYQIAYHMQEADASGNNFSSISAPVCTTAISNTIPPAITGLTSNFNNSTVMLTWNAAPGAKKYTVNKTDNGTSAGTATVTTNSYNDSPSITANHDYCYSVSYTDSCGNISPVSNPICPSILTIIDNGGTTTLSWTSNVDSSGATATYTVYLLDNNGNIIDSFPAGTNLSYIFSGDSTVKTLNFQIVAYQGGHKYYSNIYTLERSLKLFVPDAFTPNGDGANDVFIPITKYLKSMQMTIFNRWGEMVFHTDTFTGWNGTFKNAQANTDSYAYVITAMDIWGGETTKRGTVTLLK